MLAAHSLALARSHATDGSPVADAVTDRARSVAAGRALLAVVDARTPPGRIAGLVDGVDLDALLDAAHVHRVVGVLHQRFDDAGIVLPAPSRLAWRRRSSPPPVSSSLPTTPSLRSRPPSVSRSSS